MRRVFCRCALHGQLWRKERNFEGRQFRCRAFQGRQDHVTTDEQATRGAYHGSEINYVFNNLYAVDRPWTDTDRKIADIMSSYWANFAATGDPNGNDLPKWPAFDPKSLTTMELGGKFAPIPVADKVEFDFIRRYFLTQDAW